MIYEIRHSAEKRNNTETVCPPVKAGRHTYCEGWRKLINDLYAYDHVKCYIVRSGIYEAFKDHVIFNGLFSATKRLLARQILTLQYADATKLSVGLSNQRGFT